MPTAPTIQQIRSQVKAAIVKRVSTLWVDSNGLRRSVVQYPGVAGLLPLDGNELLGKPPSDRPWLRLSISGLSGTPLTLADALDQHTGVIYLSVFVPKLTACGYNGYIGEPLLDEWAGYAAALFNRYHGGLDTPTQPYRCDVSSDQRGPDEEGWLSTVVTTPFHCFSNG